MPITDPTAPNWPGDLSTLSDELLDRRLDALARYACAVARPWQHDPDDLGRGRPADPGEHVRALDLWAAARDEAMRRMG